MEQEFKATKLDVLEFIARREIIKANDLVNHFCYTPGGARSRLHRLQRERLVTTIGIEPGAYCLTDVGYRRLKYYEQRKRETNRVS